MVGKNRNYILTFFRIPQFDLFKAEAVANGLSYFVGQVEECPTSKKIHWQCYVEFTEPKTLKQVKHILHDPSVHAEPRRGTQQQAIDYCTKEETRLPDEPRLEFGTPKRQGKRSDLDEIYTDVKEGQTLREILIDHGGNALRIIHCIEKAMLVHHGFSSIDNWIMCRREMAEALQSRDSERYLNAQCDHEEAEKEIGVKRLVPSFKSLSITRRNNSPSSSDSD